MDLPFELSKRHKYITIYNWIKSGLKTDNIDEIYEKYIYATHCDLCEKEFKTTRDRQMEHNHDNGEFRNIVCNRCNKRKTS